MKQVYDKILLLVAVLLLAASVVVFFVLRNPESGDVIYTTALTGSDYETIERPAMQAVDIDWREPQPVEGNPDAQYDIFTPPEIYYNKSTNTFEFRAPKPPQPPQPFGLELLAIDRELYRIQLEAYFMAPSRKDEDTLVQFFLPTHGITVSGKPGSTFADHEFRVEDFRIDMVVDPQMGIAEQQPVVTIFDLTTEETIELTTQEPLFVPDSYFIEMRAVDPNPLESFTWRQAGDTRAYETTDGITYTLLSFDPDQPSVQVGKVVENEDVNYEPEATLTPETPAES